MWNGRALVGFGSDGGLARQALAVCVIVGRPGSTLVAFDPRAVLHGTVLFVANEVEVSRDTYDGDIGGALHHAGYRSVLHGGMLA